MIPHKQKLILKNLPLPHGQGILIWFERIHLNTVHEENLTWLFTKVLSHFAFAAEYNWCPIHGCRPILYTFETRLSTRRADDSIQVLHTPTGRR